MSLANIVADTKQELKDTMRFMPDVTADASDYEDWGKKFVDKLVSDRTTIAHHPLARYPTGSVRSLGERGRAVR
jgi:hypothetical protein